MNQIKNNIATHKIDATDRVLGRLATEIAVLLRGKNKPGFTLHQDWSDKVIVNNAEKVRLTGDKLNQKIYYRHSGYPGNLKEIPYSKLMKDKPGFVIQKAVAGMLPNNKLKSIWLKNLEIHRGDGG